VNTFLIREYGRNYRGPGLLAVAWFGSSPNPFPLSLSATSCLSFSVFLGIAGRAYSRTRGRGEGRGERVGLDPNHQRNLSRQNSSSGKQINAGKFSCRSILRKPTNALVSV
jgi:hypothetical protein